VIWYSSGLNIPITEGSNPSTTPFTLSDDKSISNESQNVEVAKQPIEPNNISQVGNTKPIVQKPSTQAPRGDRMGIVQKDANDILIEKK